MYRAACNRITAFGEPEIMMRAVIQRVTNASVAVGDELVGEIGPGLLVLLGVTHSDTTADAWRLADKIVDLRIFNDDAGKMNRDIIETKGAVLVVSQFTLYGNCEKGRRPSFIQAAPPDIAVPLYEEFCNAIRARGVPTATGRFGAMMKVELKNDGPVTLILESPPGAPTKN
jgi:D-tyrosyl-tRNA(Tyr) deacylase